MSGASWFADLPKDVLAELLGERGGEITAGEVGLPVQVDGKVLPCGIYGRWEA